MPLPYPLLNLVHFGISFAFTRAIGANLGGWFLEGRAPVEIAVEIDPARFRRTRGTARQFLVDRTATIARDFVRLTFGAERPGVLAIVAPKPRRIEDHRVTIDASPPRATLTTVRLFPENTPIRIIKSPACAKPTTRGGMNTRSPIALRS
jgi:hypothetical protein